MGWREVLERCRNRIVDVHAHVGRDQRFMLDGSEAVLLRAMDRYGIRTAWVSAVSSLTTDFRDGNREVAALLSRYPERFRGLVAVNPNFGEEALKELRRRAREGFSGVKLHPEYFRIRMTHPFTIRVLEEAVRLRLPVMIHSYDGGVEVERLADLFPELTIVMYHMGGVRWREGVERATRLDNVYLEISSSVTEMDMVGEAVRRIGADRVLFGSDMPYLEPAVSLGKVLGANIGEEDMEAILYRNAEAVLG